MPVGGGGLISGIAFAIKSLNPKVKVYGVQAEGAASMVLVVQEAVSSMVRSICMCSSKKSLLSLWARMRHCASLLVSL